MGPKPTNRASLAANGAQRNKWGPKQLMGPKEQIWPKTINGAQSNKWGLKQLMDPKATNAAQSNKWSKVEKK